MGGVERLRQLTENGVFGGISEGKPTGLRSRTQVARYDGLSMQCTDAEEKDGSEDSKREKESLENEESGESVWLSMGKRRGR